MITLLTGENSFEVKRSLDGIVAAFDGVAEKYEGMDLEVRQLPDLLQGATLFASNRLVVIKGLSENKSLWEALPQWLDKISDDVHVVLVETKPDKRTRAYKDIQKHAGVKEFGQWTDRDVSVAESWVLKEAQVLGMNLDKKTAQQLVRRVGVDQWRLHSALQKLSVLDEVTGDVIEHVIEANPTENVFNLLDAALRNDTAKVQEMIRVLERDQDPYMTFGLLSGQVYQLAVLACSEEPAAKIASGIGAHPYALGKLVPHAKKLGRAGAKRLASIFADTDVAMKSTATDPWLLVEAALVKTASV